MSLIESIDDLLDNRRTIFVSLAIGVAALLFSAWLTSSAADDCRAACRPRPGIIVRIDHEDTTCMCRWDDGTLRPQITGTP